MYRQCQSLFLSLFLLVAHKFCANDAFYIVRHRSPIQIREHVVPVTHVSRSAHGRTATRTTSTSTSIRYPCPFPNVFTSTKHHRHQQHVYRRCCLHTATASLEIRDDNDGNDKPPSQSVAAATFSLIKAIVGSGVLALPAGLAVVSDTPKAVLPASLFVAFLGSLSAYSFYLIGKMCHQNGAKSLGELWDKAIGKESSWFVTLSVFIFALGGALAYSIVLGDAFSSLAQTIGLQGWLTSRHASILAVTFTALWPLCSLSSLAALAPFSVVGVIGTLVTCFFMAFRYLSPLSPYALKGGAFLPALPPTLQPVFGSKYNLLSPSSLILASISACSFLAHYLAPDFYHVLGSKETDHQILKKFRRLTLFGFGGVCLINVAILAFGFLTFGGNCSGVILNNYSTADLGATICRLLMALCVIGGFPFLLNASRSTFFQLLSQNEDEISKPQRRKVTVGLISLITGLALLLEDAGVVLSLNGAVMGSAMIYIFPAMLFLRSTENQIQEGSLKMTRGLKVERFISRFLLGFGALSAVLGGTVTIINKTCPALLL